MWSSFFCLKSYKVLTVARPLQTKADLALAVLTVGTQCQAECLRGGADVHTDPESDCAHDSEPPRVPGGGRCCRAMSRATVPAGPVPGLPPARGSLFIEIMASADRPGPSESESQ